MDDEILEVSVFRPSYSATFLACEGSLIPGIGAADTAGYDAAVGTVFHQLIAEWQQQGVRPDYRLGEVQRVYMNDKVTYFDVEIDEDMFSFGEECLARYSHIPGDRFYETRVDISSITPIPNQGGTADLAICSKGVLDIVDWKYGRGIQVFAEGNTQGLMYAWGFFIEFDHIYDFQTIRIHIAQPRLNHFDVYEIDRDALALWSDWAQDRMRAAWVPNAPRTASPKACFWCKIQRLCPAFEVARQALVDLSFDVLEEPVSDDRQRDIVVSRPTLMAPPQLSTEQLAQVQRWRRVMEKWFADGADELITRGLNGDDLGGLWKVVEGRSKRRWIDEELMVRRLVRLGINEGVLRVSKVVSPNQAEPLLRSVGVRGKLTKAYVALYVERPPGKPTLVGIGDNRAEVGSIVDQSFEGSEEL